MPLGFRMYSLPLADFKTAPEVSCVYKMVHPDSRREYVGRTANLRDRMRKHWQELISGKHKNPKITHTFSKYGDGFVVTTLVIASPEYCEELEGKLLSAIDLKNSLNCHRSNVGGWRGQEWSAESRKKLSDARKGKPISKEAQARAAETRKTSVAWKAHQEKMASPEVVAKALAAAAMPEARARAVATRAANGFASFSDETRQAQRDASKARVFAALDWAVATGATRDAALVKFKCSWDGLKKYQPSWEEIKGPLTLSKRASGEKNGRVKWAKSNKETA